MNSRSFSRHNFSIPSCRFCHAYGPDQGTHRNDDRNVVRASNLPEALKLSLGLIRETLMNALVVFGRRRRGSGGVCLLMLQCGLEAPPRLTRDSDHLQPALRKVTAEPAVCSVRVIEHVADENQVRLQVQPMGLK